MHPWRAEAVLGWCSRVTTTRQEERECRARKKEVHRATMPVTAAFESAVAFCSHWNPFGRIVPPVAVVLGAAKRHALHGVHSAAD
jgi:hypothetical protein